MLLYNYKMFGQKQILNTISRCWFCLQDDSACDCMSVLQTSYY